MPDSIPELDPGLDAFAASLRQMLPSAPQIRTDELIFEAGRSSVSSRFRYLWQGVAAGFALLSVGLGYQLLDRPVRTVTVERNVPVEHVVAIGETATALPLPSAPPVPSDPIGVSAPEAVPAYPYGPSPSPEVPALRRGSMWDGIFTTSRRPDPRSPLQKQQDRIRKVGDLPAMPTSVPGLPPDLPSDLGSDDDLGLPSLPGGILGSPTRRH